MKAVVLDALGGSENFRLAEVTTPSPSPNQVRIKIKTVAFNPLDCKVRQERYKGSFPAILGADCAGVIDSVGGNVKDWKIGEEVYAFVQGPCSNGSYAEYVALPPTFIACKPTRLTFAQAAGVPLTALTAYRTLCASRALQAGQAVFIAGATGGVGTMAVQVARHLGACPILVSAGGSASCQHLNETLGIPLEHILDYRGRTLEEMSQALLNMNNGRLIPTVCDFVGRGMKQLCMSVVDFNGHMVTIVEEKKGLPDLWNRDVSPAFQKSFAIHFVFVPAEALIGSPASWSIYSEHLTEITRLINEDVLHIPVPKVLSGLSVDNVRLAHQLLEEGHQQGKVVMEIES